MRDAGSLNGTYVNQERIDDEVVLHHGDELQVGKFRLVFFERDRRLSVGMQDARTCPSVKCSDCCSRSSPTSRSPRSGSSRARA